MIRRPQAEHRISIEANRNKYKLSFRTTYIIID